MGTPTPVGFARILEANPNRVVFLLHTWPDLVSALQSLTEALLQPDHAARTPKAVTKAVERLCNNLAAFIDPTADSRGLDYGEAGGGGGVDGTTPGRKAEHGTLFRNLKSLQTA